IEAGVLAEQSLDELAARVGIGARQLRRLFVERVGAPPISVHTTRRLLFAKQLLTETALPVTEVALASGFRSLRRFNAAFLQANRIPPRELRRHPRAAAGAALVLRLGYRPPYDFAALLAFLRTRALPGVELVDEHSYARVFGPVDAPGWLRVRAWPGGEHALQLELHCPQSTQLLGVVTTLRRMFDLDANPQAIADTFRHDAILGPLPTAPMAGLERLFPTPAALAQADLREIGVTTTRAATISGMAQALLDGRVDFRAEQSLDEFVARWVALPGIGEWTAHYMAMRALSDPDAFPAADLILRREATPDTTPLGTKALTLRAEAWRPWRAYAV